MPVIEELDRMVFCLLVLLRMVCSHANDCRNYYLCSSSNSLLNYVPLVRKTLAFHQLVMNTNLLKNPWMKMLSQNISMMTMN